MDNNLDLSLVEQQECSRLFQKLKPLCVNLSKEPTINVIASLQEVILAAEIKYLKIFQEYVLFPLRLHLTKYPNICEKTFVNVVECITLVVSRAPVKKWSLHSELFNSLCRILGSHEQKSNGPELTEEVTAATLRCLNSVVCHCDFGVAGQLYSPTFLPALGHAVSRLLSCIENGPSPDIRLGACRTLQSLLQSHRADCDDLHLLVGDRFATFLPGASTTLSRVITKQSGQGHAVVVAALDSWSQLLRCVLADKQLDACSKMSEKKTTAPDVMDARITGLLVTRDIQWAKDTGHKLAVLVCQVTRLTAHSHWRVRQAVVTFAASLLSHCIKSLSACVNSLLEILVASCHDDYPEVADISHNALQAYRQNRDARPLCELLEENIYNLVTALPRQIRMASDSDKLLSLTVLHSYLDLLGTDVGRVLMSSVHLTRLLTSLVQALDVDCSHAKIVQETMFHPAETLLQNDAETLQPPDRQYRHFNNDRIEAYLLKICKTLGRNGDPYILVDHLSNKLTDGNPHVTGALIALNNIVAGIAERSDANHDIIRGLVSQYIEELHMHPEEIQLNKDPSPFTPGLVQLNTNVIKTCLYLEGLAACSKVLATSHLERFLMDVLHPTLQHLGHENASICTTAYFTLMQFCHVASYTDIPSLLQTNADYLINSLSRQLRHASCRKDVTRVLCVTLQFAAPSILPLLHSIIHEILLNLDSRYEESLEDFVMVLHQLVSSISRWFAHEQLPKKDNKTEKATGSISERVTSFIEAYHNNWITVNRASHDDRDTDSPLPDVDDSDGEDIPEKESIPQHIDLVKEVLIRTKHLMSCDSMRVCLLVLDTISVAADIFVQHTDELLPLVHQLWEPLVLRFSDKNIPVVIKAFETVVSLSKTCGDFIRQRTVSRVVPSLLADLHRYHTHSYNCPNHYHFTASYKLQLCLLTNLGSPCSWLGVSEKEAATVVDVCTPYLDKHQPVALQNACKTTLCELAAKYPDVVWLSLLPFGIAANIDRPVSSKDQLSEIEFPQENPDYIENVKQLAAEIL